MLNRYSRQIIFPEIGEEGQKKLKSSFVVIIGCGARGTVIALALGRKQKVSIGFERFVKFG